MTTEPKNAQQAMALALRQERAKQILAQGYTFTDMEGDGSSIAVCKPRRLAASYWIVDGECDCGDAMKGNFCKHRAAWLILQSEMVAEQAGLEALCARYDDCEGYLDAIPTPTLESIAAKDLHQRMSADLQRVEMAIHTHGARLVNPIQCLQDRNRAAALQCAVHVVSEYR